MAHANRSPKDTITRTVTLFALLAFSSTAVASTVMEVGVADLLEESSLVIHGRVTEQWVELDTGTDTLFTSFRIEIDAVIKGTSKDKSIVIKFAGGSLAGRTLSIGGMVMPIVGEEGVYFVERPDRLQTNPLYGWQQGHFVVRFAENGIDKRIMTHDLRPIYAVTPASRNANIHFSSGTPLGIRTEPLSDESPLTLASFIEALRAIAEVQ